MTSSVKVLVLMKLYKSVDAIIVIISVINDKPLD